MNKLARRLVVGTVCASMVLGSTGLVFASGAEGASEAADNTSGNVTGTGAVEGSLSTDVFNVVVPTVNAATYNFTLDPEGLIAQSKTNNASKDDYTDATFEEGATLFFKNEADDKTTDYSSKTDPVTATNKGTTDVDVTVTAEVKDATGITIAADDKFENDTKASLYLALQDVPAEGDPTTVAVDASTNKATLTGTIDGVDASKYLVKYDSDSSSYVYALDEENTTDTDFPTYSFVLTGAANAAGDWSALTEVTPSVTITWSFVQHVDSYFGTVKTISASSNVVTATGMPEGTTIKSIILTTSTGTTADWKANKKATISNTNTITVDKTSINNNKGATLTITFSDDKVDTLTLE
jgi:hypothetical protein